MNTPAAARYRIVFVCMGNICRSPTAHGVLRHRLAATGLDRVVAVDSAGTHSYHIGATPDARSREHARARGYDLDDLQARRIDALDFANADLLLAMDWDNLALLEAACPTEHRHKLRRLAEFFQRHDSPVVPDPYEGGPAGFERVLDLVEDGCDGLLQHLGQAHVIQQCLPAWTLDAAGNHIWREWQLADYAAAMHFIQRVGELAQAHNHHPDLWNSWTRVRVSLTTHDVGGLSWRDLALAAAIDDLT